MKNLTRRPHPFIIWRETGQPHECLATIRDLEYEIEAGLPVQICRREPEVIDIAGDFDSYGNVQQDMGSSRINYKLIR